MRRGWFVLMGTLVSGGCAPTPPPLWADGGAKLVIAPAVWQRADDDRVEITAKGEVLEDGSLVFVVDRAGRVVDDDYAPVAILLDDGFLIATDERSFGQVGVANASPPGQESAWLSVLPDGRVIRFDSDGERTADGAWKGCDGPQHRTCTLVTHVLSMRSYSTRPRTSFGVGVGVGFYP